MLGRRWLSPSSSSSCRSFSSLLLRRLRLRSRSAPPPPHLPPRSPSRRFFSTSAAAVEQTGRGDGGKTPVARRVVHVFLLSLTGGLALSAFNDLAIFHGCSSKAIEKASQNQEVVEALGEPIARGPWYDASLAVGRRRNTVSCKFPVSGPKGNAVLKIKAVRTGGHNDWDILISEALLQNEQKQISRMILIDNFLASDARRKNSRSMEPGDQENK